MGAIVGGALTIAGDVSARLYFDRKRSADLQRSVEDEVAWVTEESRAREEEVSGGVGLRPPLPTAAWEAYVASGLLSRMAADKRAGFLEFYRRVGQANALIGSAVAFLGMSHAAEGEAAAALQREAVRLTTEPFASVREAGDALRMKESRRLDS